METRDLLIKTHFISVTLFLLIYLIKTVLLLTNAKNALASFKRVTKVPEMIVSTLFLLTGVWLLVETGSVTVLQIVKLVLVFGSIPMAVIAYKRENKALAVISLVFIIAAFGLAEMNKKQLTKVKSGAVSGQEIYSSNCARCHGDDGKKGVMEASDLSVSTLSDEEVKAIIVNGRKGMPPIKMEAAQLDSVAVFVKSLRK